MSRPAKRRCLPFGFAVLLTAACVTAAHRPHPTTNTLTVTFYDANGAAMSGQAAYDAMRNKADNLSNGYASKVVAALVNPTTLEDLNPANTGLIPTIHATDLAFTLPADTSAALAATWPTSTTRGYSQVLLDNAGAGYSTTTTINFTYQAARDLKHRFDLAVTARTGATPAYVPSSSFTTARNLVNTDYIAMTAASTDSQRGKYGRKVMSDLHAAFDILLTEYGPQVARYKDEANQGSPWLGTTFDNATASNAAAGLGYAQNATLPTGVSSHPGYGWVRIVFDVGVAPPDYDTAVKQAHQKGLLVMGMPFDSTSARACLPVTKGTHCTAAEYQTRFATYVDHFSHQPNPALNIDAWEVGNEINGEWIDSDPTTGAYTYGSGEMATKVATAADYVHRHTNAAAVGTLYWQLATSKYPKNSTFTWAKSNLVSSGYASKLDVILLSSYIEDAPMGSGFDQIMQALIAMFPGKQVGLGEFDYFYTDTSRYFWALTHLNAGSNQAQAQTARPALCIQYFSEALGYNPSVGGGFWWYFQEESSGTTGTNLRNAIKGVANKVYFG